MSISIGTLSSNERQEWENLYRGYTEFYQVPMTSEILVAVWNWIFDAEVDFYALVARNEEKLPIGLMHFREMPSPLRGKYVGFLDDLFVLPVARWTGVVDKMFIQLTEESVKNGWPFVRWITAEDNYRGRSVYDRTAEKTKWVTYHMNV